MEFNRVLDLPSLLERKSFFLFGARSTGKTTLIRRQLGERCLSIDLLETDTFLRLSQEPHHLERMIAAAGKGVIVIDEVQKLPLLGACAMKHKRRRPDVARTTMRAQGT